MKKYIFAIICIVALGLTSCKDFFDISNPQTLSQENFPSTMEQVDQLVTAAYAQNHAFGLYAFYWFPMGIWLYDHTTDLYGSYDERAFSQDNYSTPESRYLTTTYTDICKWATLSTLALEGIEFYRQTAPESEKEELDYRRGQCLFNRALAYWHGQIFFEIKADGLGMPIIDEVLSDAERLKRPRKSVKECWLFMINDLEEACRLLKGHTEDKVDGEYRVTYWSAMGLLAKVYMQSLYILPNADKAQAVMEDIINKSGKTLVPYNVYCDMFYGNEANEHNSESLYEITCTTDYTQNGPWQGYTTGSGMPLVYAPWFVNLNIAPIAADPMTLPDDVITCAKSSEWGNNFVHDKNIARFGFWGFHGDTVPRWTLNENFVPKSKLNPKQDSARSIHNFPYRLYDETYQSEARALKQDKNRVDPRLMICTGQPYVDYYINDKGDSTWYDRSSELNTYHDVLGWHFRKYTNIHGLEKGAAPYGKNQSSDCNIHVVRLADIYLLYAELMSDKDPGLALQYVNKVHARAYGDDDSYNYHSLTDRTKAWDDKDPLANDVIRYERWAELFAEGQWWLDVRRYQIGNQEANYYQSTRHGDITWKGDCSYVQPIPQLEIERNENMVQSQGY
ncbi:MAG: RagB/SusD family nutrient uptake outer membrane protein [Paludibacteraceae bacterium]|nr:RagB/SusD family nutrient uptake outer membrane protein [Paludibacteraceae bacterium]